MSQGKNELEFKVRNAFVRFCKAHLRRGPRETRVFIAGDRILLWFRGVLTPAEIDIARSEDASRSVALLRELFGYLLKLRKPQMEEALGAAFGTGVRFILGDLYPDLDEGFLMFVTG